MKREHRVLCRQRLRNASAGFGLCSNSWREADTLTALSQQHIGCPEVMAVGEDDEGRAFLLTKAFTGFIEVREFLVKLQSDPSRRRRFARRLGETLADVHKSRFNHPDLYSKHIYVHETSEEIRIIDWQRARRTRRPNPTQCWHDLAALNATISDELGTTGDRFACLKSYLRRQCGDSIQSSMARSAAHAIVRHTETLRRRRRIRELCENTSAAMPQSVIWLDGEALCLTPEFHRSLNGKVPDWLRAWDHAPKSNRAPVAIVRNDRGCMSRRSAFRPFRLLWAWLRGTRPTTPEIHRAGLIFRLQRYGIATPVLLAFGQRHRFPGNSSSFLLTQSRPHGERLDKWLARFSGTSLWAVERKKRWQVVRSAAQFLRRLHDAGCCLPNSPGDVSALLIVDSKTGREPCIALDNVDAIRTFRRRNGQRRLADLRCLRTLARRLQVSKADQLRFLLTYLNVDEVCEPVRRALIKMAYGRWAERRLGIHYRSRTSA